MQTTQERGVCQPEKSALMHLSLPILPVLKGPGQPPGWRAADGHPGRALPETEVQKRVSKRSE